MPCADQVEVSVLGSPASVSATGFPFAAR
jgi:hypothetical protein